MAVFNIGQAKIELARLLSRAEAGEEIIIARRNKPVVKLVPLNAASKAPRVPGAFGHLQGEIPDSFFFDPLPEGELRAWEGTSSDDEDP